MTAVRVGLDIGGTKIHGVAVDAADPELLHAQIRIPTMRGPQGVVASALQAVSQLLEAAGADAEPIALGIGVPGAVGCDGILTNAVNLLIDSPMDLRGILTAAVGIPVTVNNDVDAAACGVARWLVSRGETPDVALLSIGTGLAAGFVLDGRLRRGATSLVGELGHLAVVPNGPLCSCGQRGCIEMYASGRALERQWHHDGHDPAPVAVFDAADAGDVEAIAIRETFLSWLGTAIRIATLAVDPAHVVLTGGVMRLGERITAPLLERLGHDAHTSPFVASLRLRERTMLLPADHPAAALGAAELSDPENGRRR